MHRLRSILLLTAALLAGFGSLGACGAVAPDRGISGPRSANASVLAVQSFSEWSEPVALNSRVNTAADEFGPALSKDGLTLYFASTRTGSAGIDIWVAHRGALDEEWGDAELVAALNSKYNENVPNLSRDQHWLFFGSNRPNPRCAMSPCDNDLWASYRGNVHDQRGWQSPVNLGEGVNTAAAEAGPSLMESDQGRPAQLYFNRVDRGLEAEIYASEQAPDGSFGPAQKVQNLNSEFTEQRSSIHHNGLEIYFFSNRPGFQCPVAPCNGNDIWMSHRENVLDMWSTPTNLGPSINTGASEIHPHIFAGGRVEELYFVRFAPSGDIYVTRRSRDAAR